ncbi:MAG TPA: DUF5916 domain-containing protein [Woeseiaceae bacterium]|nr:DUF5916 domain-containing protein [Woeseiaceae bacterium]
MLARYAFAAITAFLAASSASAIARGFPQRSGSTPAARKEIRAIYTATPPVLDGRLTDPAWQDAAVVDDLHMVVPNEYAPPSEPSRIYILYDANTLYFAARFRDSEPDKVTANVMRQGDQSEGEDAFSIMLDPFNQGRNGYVFKINPNGVRSQAFYTNVRDLNWSWQGIWRGAAARDGDGWTAEVAIPFKTLSFNPDNDAWGLNFTRWLGRRHERFGWVSHNHTQNPANSGQLAGLVGIEQGFGLDIVPGVSMSGVRNYTDGLTDTGLEPSVDVFYKVTPAMTAALTVHPDFSGTSVDTRRINLTRFDLFFPEQRKFFLQDADIFAFGAIEEEGPMPFFSRRIGLAASGEALDIDVGAKLTGRAGGFDIGVLDIRQETPDHRGTRSLLVARVAKNVLSESSVGMIVTKGDPISNLDNALAGVDFRYLNTRIGNNRTIIGSAWYQQSDTEGLHGNDAAMGIALELPSEEGWRAELEWREVQPNYYPALGFVDRTDVHESELELGYAWRPLGSRIRSVATNVEFTRVEKIGGDVESRNVEFTVLELENHAADDLELSYLMERERLTEPFEISKGVVIPPGDYAFNSYCVELATGEQRVLASGSFACDGDFYGGRRRSAGSDLIWRPNPHYQFGLGFEWNDIDLPAGSFITRLANLRADVAFTATWYWENFVQYDNVSDSIGINSILRWVPEAGRETVLVLNRQFEDFDGGHHFRSTYAELTFKLGYTLRF